MGTRISCSPSHFRVTGSYTWRIWSRGTSFYIKPRHPPVAGFKVSLHGPRRPGDDSVWKVAVDWRDRDAAAAAGGLAIPYDDFKQVFHGRRIAPGGRLVVRIHNPWNTFHRGSPSGPGPHEVESGDHGRGFHCVVKPPRQMAFAYVDIYVSDRARTGRVSRRSSWTTRRLDGSRTTPGSI